MTLYFAELGYRKIISIFYLTYFRHRRPLLRPHLVAVAEATWKNKKLCTHMYGKILAFSIPVPFIGITSMQQVLHIAGLESRVAN